MRWDAVGSWCQSVECCCCCHNPSWGPDVSSVRERPDYGLTEMPADREVRETKNSDRETEDKKGIKTVFCKTIKMPRWHSSSHSLRLWHHNVNWHLFCKFSFNKSQTSTHISMEDFALCSNDNTNKLLAWQHNWILAASLCFQLNSCQRQ